MLLILLSDCIFEELWSEEYNLKKAHAESDKCTGNEDMDNRMGRGNQRDTVLQK